MNVADAFRRHFLVTISVSHTNAPKLHSMRCFHQIINVSLSASKISEFQRFFKNKRGNHINFKIKFSGMENAQLTFSEISEKHVPIIL